MAKSALDLFKQAYKGSQKQIAPMRVRAVKGQNIRNSKVLAPFADNAESLMSEAYANKHIKDEEELQKRLSPKPARNLPKKPNLTR